MHNQAEITWVTGYIYLYLWSGKMSTGCTNKKQSFRTNSLSQLLW